MCFIHHCYHFFTFEIKSQRLLIIIFEWYTFQLLGGIVSYYYIHEYKYTLGQDMKRDAIQLVRSIYRANKAKDKVVYLEAFLDDFELLKFEIRLCVDMKILAIKKQAELSGLLDSIGKQITGWRNANR